MRRAFSDALASAAALAVLLAILVAFDGRVREQVTMRLGGEQASADLAEAGNRVHGLASVLFEVVRDQSQMHVVLLIFVVAATVLTLFMVRT
jgi:hypothetical protein